MTTEEAIHRAALRKHRHKGNYIATHEALLAERRSKMSEARVTRAECGEEIWFQTRGQRRSLWQIIKGWFA